MREKMKDTSENIKDEAKDRWEDVKEGVRDTKDRSKDKYEEVRGNKRR